MELVHFTRLRTQAKKLASRAEDRLGFSRGFVVTLMEAYGADTSLAPVNGVSHTLAREIGELMRSADDDMASYLISTVYTAMLPETYRSQYGIFFTPPGLTSRLLDQAEAGGVDWSTARVLDPSCGGGAFLSPIAVRMRRALSGLSVEARVAHIERHLVGFEIDPFSAWMSQTFVELVLAEDLINLGRRLKPLVVVRDSLLSPESDYGTMDLVVGNPPYGKVKLDKQQRSFWQRSLHGHANLYGLFTDLAVRLAAPGGVIAYVTPTSFLGGQYFQALRKLMATHAPPYAVDFIDGREGVFEDVLQETMLTCYRKEGSADPLQTAYLSILEDGRAVAQVNGRCGLPQDGATPWILPRRKEVGVMADSARSMPYRLSDYGYKVSTGQLVWNRHKDKIFDEWSLGVVPLVWAECVDPAGSGVFTFKTTRRHAPWFLPGPKDAANLTHTSCVLLQRTTAVEQRRRLIAAEIPQDFIDNHGGAVAVENHLNMVRPLPGQRPKVSPAALSRLFNSQAVDDVYRCISGSTAVSAYELQALPLPSPHAIERLENLMEERADEAAIESYIRELYVTVRTSAAA